MTEKKTIIHVITGDGQGKTTASLGLALRAIGAGKRVKLIQFLKKPEFSEHDAIRKFNLPIDVETFGIGFYKILGDKHTETEHKEAASRALAAAKKAIGDGNYDVIILDEINVAVGFGLADVNEVISIILSDNGRRTTDLILTGRRAHAKIKKIADRVSEIKNIKNHFDAGVEARKGIEF